MQKISREKVLETMLTIATGLMVIHLITHKKGFLTIAILIGIIGISSYYLSSKITWAWFKLAEGLGYVNSKILLSLVFFVFLTPVAFVFKLFNCFPIFVPYLFKVFGSLIKLH